MGIEEGEFYRTKKGEIRNVEDLDDYSFLIDKFYFQIVKHSKNIIDLVEAGDYVNGHLVVEISKNAYNQKLVITEVDGKDGAIRHHYLEKSIKTVVTHEQMQSIEYKVEEDK